MPWLIDGSNVLGAMRVDRHSETAKRHLVKLLASFARAKRTRVTCFFDGPEPGSFGRGLGSVSVVFSGPRTADDLIVERARNGRGWSVVTSDAALAGRIRGRHVEVVSPQRLLGELDRLGAEAEGGGEDWASWFSDPKNRTPF
jgi:predicted RNA-binding protein with PIN domain